jgi:hypothetical protein
LADRKNDSANSAEKIENKENRREEKERSAELPLPVKTKSSLK